MRLSPMKLVWGALAAVAAAVAVLTIRPDLVPHAARVSLTAPYAQLVALRGWQALLLLTAALFFVIIGIVRRVILRRGRIAFALAGVLVACSVAHVATVVSRGTDNRAQLSADRGVSHKGAGDGSITVMQYNTEGGRVGTEDLADLIVRNGVDVVTLVETSKGSGAKLVAELKSRGLAFAQFDNDQSRYEADWGSTVVLVSEGMGEYTVQSLPEGLAEAGVPAVAVVPANGAKGPGIIAVHTVAPTDPSLNGRRMAAWKEQIAATYRACGKDTILAGDFNSTVDHELALGGGDSTCKDAVAEAGSGGVGTWPSNVSPLLGSPIDRVMSPEGYRGSQAAIVDAGPSDHRGVIVRLEKD